MSLTDPEARVIKIPDGGFRPAYNMQIVTAAGSQIIVALNVTASGSDGGLLRPMVEKLHLHGVKPKRYLADGGFTNKADIEWAHARDLEVYCPGKVNKGVDPYAPRSPDGPGLRRWRERMASAAGQAIYDRRRLHECVNAHARRQGFIRLLVRGIDKARTILRWHALTNNLLTANRLAATV